LVNEINIINVWFMYGGKGRLGCKGTVRNEE
jgi:hypothetical protein